MREKIVINSLDVQMFCKLVENKYTYENDYCEIEQTLDAMRAYLQYPLYENWNIEKHDCKAGSWKLVSEQEVLTADIITSIGQAVRKISSKIIPTELKGKKIKGVHIAKAIVDNPFCNICNGAERGVRYKICFKENTDIKEVKSFALVVYWIGNMMPVPQNLSTGTGGKNDTWHYKMKYILDILYNRENTNHQWDVWRVSNNNVDEFIKGNYLQDMFICDDGKYIVKEDKEDEWFINNTKLIIQRSYRIVNKFHGEWDDVNKENVQKIFAEVFNQAGFDYEKSEELKKIF